MRSPVEAAGHADTCVQYIFLFSLVSVVALDGEVDKRRSTYSSPDDATQMCMSDLEKLD